MNRWLLGFLVFAVLLALRLGTAAALDTLLEISRDVDIYASIARNLAAGHGFVHTTGDTPVLWRAPLYPVFLAGVFSIFGNQNELAVLVVQCALDAATATLVWWIGAQRFSNGVGLVAAALYALYPLSAYYSLRLLPEPLFTFGLAVFLVVFLHARQSPRAWRFGLLGIVGGLITLIKPSAVALVPFLAVALLLRRRKTGACSLACLIALLAMFVVTVSPWSLRNYLVSGHFVPIASGGGYSLWIGNHLRTDGREDDELQAERLQHLLEDRAAVGRIYESLQAEQSAVADADPSEINPGGSLHIAPGLDRVFQKIALEEMATHPVESLVLMARKFIRFWFDIYQTENRWAQIWVYLSQGTLLTLALFGLLRAYRAKVDVFPFVVVILYFSLTHAALVATLRYSIPLVPLLMNFAVFAAAGLLARVNESFRRDANTEDPSTSE